MAGDRGEGEGPGDVEGTRRVAPQRRSAGRYVVDNIPYAAMAALGAWVLLSIHWAVALLEVAAAILGPLYMIRVVCPNCLLYGSPHCQSGYGLVSAMLAPRGDPDRFKDVFSVHVWSVVPMWFLPVAGMLYLLVVGSDLPMVEFALFFAVAFVGVPLKARYVTCPKCPKRADCPWGSRASLPRR
jgi:hypothetical protein